MDAAITLRVGKSELCSTQITWVHEVTAQGCLTHLPLDSTTEKGGSSRRKRSRMRSNEGAGPFDINTVLKVLEILTADARHKSH